MIGNDFDTPIMYQDLANYSMGPMSMPQTFGMMPGMNTSYLGGTQITPQLDHDKVEIMNRKNKEAKKTAKNVAIALGIIFLAGFIPYFRKKITSAGGFKKYLSNGWDSSKNLFKSTPSAPSAPKSSRWQAFKNWFKPKATP